MSKLAHLKEHIHALEDIHNIMKAMKNHALFEINKMTKYISTHEKSIKTIKDVGSDFFSFYPSYFPVAENTQSIICILIGSERGLCGNFNEAIIQQFNDFEKNQPGINLKLIIVGRKLAMRMVDDNRVIREINGYETTDEISTVILNLIHTLENVSSEMKIKLHPVSWRFFFNENNDDKIQTNILQPFVEFSKVGYCNFSFPPLLYLSVDNFLLEFIEQYLLAILYFIFYRSFFAENYQRLRHLDAAVERLEKDEKQLVQHLNLIRQEEITQEIEVILLSVEVITNEIRNEVL